jgi:hypothetical protein
MLEERRSNPLPLPVGQNVCVTDQVHIANPLEADDADELACGLITPKPYATSDLVIEFISQHVGLVPAIGRNDTPISLSGGIDDIEDEGSLVISANSNIAHKLSPFCRIPAGLKNRHNPGGLLRTRSRRQNIGRSRRANNRIELPRSPR